MSLSLSNSLSFGQIPKVKFEKIAKNPIFQTLTLTRFVLPYLVTTPPTGFLQFKKSFLKDIWEINFFVDFLDVYAPSLKIW